MAHATPKPAPTNVEKYETAASHPEALERILKRVRYERDCWIWTGAKNASGYAVATVNKQSIYVHRLAHWIVRGPIPEGMVADHLCRTPSCVNPIHLQAVTPLENTRRGEGNGKQTRCPQGHPYDKQNTRYNTDKRGYTRRNCITCVNARNRARAA